MVKTIKDKDQMIEAEIFKMLDILKNGESNEQKKKARKEILRLEKHIRDTETEYHNGHKYPERLSWSDDKPMNVKELHKLIDSVESNQDVWNVEKNTKLSQLELEPLDLSGVSVGKDRFEFVEKGKVESSILDGKK